MLGREGGSGVEGEEGPSCEATPLPLPQSFWPHMPTKPSSGLAQVFGQQDLSVSNPSSGSQILWPCGVLPFS